MTVSEFARTIGYSVGSVSSVELGYQNGGPEFIRLAAKVLRCKVKDITNGRIEHARVAGRLTSESGE